MNQSRILEPRKFDGRENSTGCNTRSRQLSAMQGTRSIDNDSSTGRDAHAEIESRSGRLGSSGRLGDTCVISSARRRRSQTHLNLRVWRVGGVHAVCRASRTCATVEPTRISIRHWTTRVSHFCIDLWLTTGCFGRGPMSQMGSVSSTAIGLQSANSCHSPIHKHDLR